MDTIRYQLRFMLVIVLIVALVPMVSAEDQRIRLVGERTLDARIVPASGNEPDVSFITPSGRKKLAEGAFSADLARGGLFILQLRADADDEIISEYERAGVILHQYLGGGAWYATLPAGSALHRHQAVRAIVRPDAAGKVSPLLSRSLVRAQANTEVVLMLSLTATTSLTDVRTHLVALGGSLEIPTLLQGSRARVRVPAAQVLHLAAWENVLAVEPGDLRKKTLNAKTAGFINADDARTEYGLSGNGINVGVWDGGSVYAHKELAGRVTVVDKVDADDHATHVSGTIAATGVNASARGMAPKARIFSWDYEGDVATEMSNGVNAYNIILSNNSWGYVQGWEYGYYYITGWGNIWSWHGASLFGAYTAESGAIDSLIYSKNLTVVFSAGNDRNDKPVDLVYYDTITDQLHWGFFTGQDGPYNIVGPPGTGKNVITVGATQGITSMSNFSNWGPTDDGRVKPEISANGVNVFSSVTGNTYDTYSGTSMSAPATTGSLALLAEMWKKYFGVLPSAAALRNLIVLTAREVKSAGPDYEFGFGVLDVQNAARFIEAASEGGLLSETTVKRKKMNVYDLTIASGVSNVRVCLTWLDPAGPTLVNDLDLVLISPTGATYYPWTLDPAKRSSAAKAMPNHRDNIEVISLKKPKAGEGWQIQVRATNLRKGKNQAYTLAVW